MHDLFDKFPSLSVAVLGDYCLDEYFRIDAALNEPSLETGLAAYQCVKNESFPGAAGTVAKNFANLGVGKVYAVGFVGDDGRGLELLRGLGRLGIDCGCVIASPERVTPCYTKPWITENGVPRELNRIDVKNWTPTPERLADAVMERLGGLMGRLDAVVVLDQYIEENCGIVTETVRERLAALGRENPGRIFFADSRSRIGAFKSMMIKGNEHEVLRAAFGGGAVPGKDGGADYAGAVRRAGEILQERTGRPVITTLGAAGVRIQDKGREISIPGIPLSGELDVCGAGDSFSAAFVSALAAGADMELAGTVGNAAAAVCVTQLGTSGNVTAGMIAEMMGRPR